MDTRTQEILAQVAFKEASNLVGSSLTGTGVSEPETIVPLVTALFGPLHDFLVQSVGASVGATTGGFNAEQSFKQNFPGTATITPEQAAVEQAAAAPAAPAVAQVQQQAVPVAAQQPNVVPFPAQQQPAAPAPAPVPHAAQGGAENDPYWQMFVQDAANGTLEQNWWDNRVNKKNPKAPDFKHKTLDDGKGNGYKVGLWLQDKARSEHLTVQLRQLGFVG